MPDAQQIAVDGFSRQFEPDGDGQYLYRPKLSAPGIRVSQSERDKFIENFSQAYRRARWGMMAAIIAVMLPFIWLLMSKHETAAYVIFSLALGLVMVLFILLTRRLYRVPSAALEGRVPIAPGRSKNEARRLALQRMSWSQLGTAGLVFALMLVRVGFKNNLLVGWNRLWLLGSGGLFLMLVVQAIRKWRADAAPGRDL